MRKAGAFLTMLGLSRAAAVISSGVHAFRYLHSRRKMFPAPAQSIKPSAYVSIKLELNSGGQAKGEIPSVLFSCCLPLMPQKMW